VGEQGGAGSNRSVKRNDAGVYHFECQENRETSVKKKTGNKKKKRRFVSLKRKIKGRQFKKKIKKPPREKTYYRGNAFGGRKKGKGS